MEDWTSYLAAVRERLFTLEPWDILLVISTGAAIYLTNLSSYPLRTWDEAIYADAAQNIVLRGTWPIPHTALRVGLLPVESRPFLEKPPLAFWVQSGSMQIFGISEFAARLPSAVAAILTALLVYEFGIRLFNRSVGVISSVVFLGTPYLYMGFNSARTAATDGLLILFGTLFVYCTWRTVNQNNRVWPLIMGVSGWLTVMTKGFAAGIFLFIAFPLFVWNSDVLRNRNFWVGVSLGGVLTLLWIAFMWVNFGDEWVRVFVFDQFVSKVASDGDGGPLIVVEYVVAITGDPEGFQPLASVFFPAVFAVLMDIRTKYTEKRRELLFVLWWIGAVYAPYLLIGDLDSYIYPMFVGTALVIGYFIHEVVVGRYRILGLVAIATAIVYLVSYSVLVEPIWSYITRSGAFALIGSVLLWRWKRWSDPEFSIDIPLPVKSGILLLLLVGAAGAPPPAPPGYNSDPFVDQKRLGLVAGEYVTSADTVYIQENVGLAMHTFVFYSRTRAKGVPIERLNSVPPGAIAVVNTTAVDRITRRTRVIRAVSNRQQNVSLVRIR
ncbi:ArnT family glycosyltransferase [Halosimplex amylolyticum]|uniref:ArnT family glycosyltransferase n=1 Tax=Halosimplex amylolyticum TaxID=3396616 RepID=UPI003F570AD9